MFNHYITSSVCLKPTVLAIPLNTSADVVRMAAVHEEELSMCVLLAGCMVK